MAAVKEVVGFKGLKAAGVVNNHVSLQEKIEKQGFPKGFWAGPNTHLFYVDEVNKWLASRPLERPSAAPWLKCRRVAEKAGA
jgi:hypothetical protein